MAAPVLDTVGVASPTKRPLQYQLGTPNPCPLLPGRLRPFWLPHMQNMWHYSGMELGEKANAVDRK